MFVKFHVWLTIDWCFAFYKKKMLSWMVVVLRKRAYEKETTVYNLKLLIWRAECLASRDWIEFLVVNYTSLSCKENRRKGGL